MDVAAFNDFAVQLVLLTSATAVNVSMSREKYDMVVTSCNRDDQLAKEKREGREYNSAVSLVRAKRRDIYCY